MPGVELAFGRGNSGRHPGRLLEWSRIVLCLKSARDNDPLKAGGSILAIPTSCCTGGWLTTLFDVDDILSAHLTAARADHPNGRASLPLGVVAPRPLSAMLPLGE